jgi:acyl-CoA synthetase (AMP-forming)/AMP-acid ligase II
VRLAEQGSPAAAGRESRWPVVALAGFVACYGIANSIWLLNDGSSPSFDKAAHAGFALKFLRLFEEPARLSLTKLLSVTQYWPPLFHVASVPFTLTLGFSVGSVAATNLLFLVIGATAIYRIGRLDEDGFLTIVDRKKDMIIRGGLNVYPREIEEVMLTHPAVSLAAVIGVPDERLGEEVKAFVVLKPGAEQTAAELVAWCREQMAAYKYPRSVELRESLPVGPTGKILKRALKSPG